jgi:hypothetical protein
LSLRPYAAQFAGQGRRLAPALTLLDKGTGFFRDGGRETGEEIRFLSGAPRVSLEEAIFVFSGRGAVRPDEAPGILTRVRQGTHPDPHKSALLFIAAKTGTGAQSEEPVSLKGPDIPPDIALP